MGVMKLPSRRRKPAHRPAKIVALARPCPPSRSSPYPKARILRAEQLKDNRSREPLQRSHFTTLKLLEGFLKREQIK